MYFIPKVNRNIHKSLGHLEKDIKLMRKMDLMCLDRPTFFRCYGNGSDNSLSLVQVSLKDTIVHYKIAYDDCITRSEKELDYYYIELEYSWHFLKNLPLVAFFKENDNSRKSIYLHLIGIPSTYLEKIYADDISLMFDYPVCNFKIFDCGDYIIFVTGNQEYVVTEVLVLKIQFQDDSKCEVAEVFRKDLRQFFYVNYSEIDFMKTVDRRMFLQYQTKNGCKDDGCILDLNSGDILNLPSGFMESDSRLYVVKHGNCDLLISLFPNQVKVLRYFGHGKSKPKQIDFDFSSYALCYTQFISNRNSQVLMILSKVYRREIHVFDLFDLKNKTLIFHGNEGKGLAFYFNDTGEEIYVLHQNILSVYFYCSPVKSLLSLAADIVRIIYTETELSQMNLPRDLYQIL